MVKYEFSKKTFKKEIYKTAIDDFNDLKDLLELDNYNFKKLDEMVELRYCDKSEYDFEWNTLTITIEKTKDTYKIKTIRVYDINTCDFLCYMKIKGKQNE